jgi:S1-C subfamily serine protease
VQGVEVGSPAATAGLVAGDVITSIGGQTITDSQDLRLAVRLLRRAAGDPGVDGCLGRAAQCKPSASAWPSGLRKAA